MTFVFTIFFCGTGSNILDFQRDKFTDGELISTLGVNLVGQKLITGIVIDGPGSGNRLLDEYWVNTTKYNKIRGKLTGAGWQENVAHALAVIKCKVEREPDNSELIKLESTVKIERNRLYGKSIPDVVNLIGWSRGAVSCHMLANAMFNDPELQRIKVNIFAVDPVPGLGNFTPERTTLNNNVFNYVAVYARDERSRGFAPTIPIFVGTRRIGFEQKPILIPMPGRHSTLVGNAAVDGAKGSKELIEPGKIVRDLAERYLTTWGTRLNEKLNLSDIDILGFYIKMMIDSDKYNKMHSKVYTDITIKKFTDKKGGERAVYKGTQRYAIKFSDIKGEEYFYPSGLASIERINWHHKQIVDRIQDEDKFIDKNSVSESPIDEQSINEHISGYEGSVSREQSYFQSTSTMFPHLSSLTTTLSSDSVVVNGMKVIFDQSVTATPVTIETKHEKIFLSSASNLNISEAQSLTES
jgi:hypothetical protein